MIDIIDCVIVGVFVGVFGVKGEVCLKFYCVDLDIIVDYMFFYIEDGCSFVMVVLIGQVGNVLVVWVDGIVIKEEVDVLKGIMFYVEWDMLLNLLDDEYYYVDFVGFEVFDVGGQLLGIVKLV